MFLYFSKGEKGFCFIWLVYFPVVLLVLQLISEYSMCVCL